MANVTVQVHAVDGHDLCRVHVRPSALPVEAKVVVDRKGQFERKTAFYVRLANRTREIADPVERERYIAGRWTEPAANPVDPPPLSPEELAEIRAVVEQVGRGDYSGTIPWEEIANEFDLPSSYGS